MDRDDLATITRPPLDLPVTASAVWALAEVWGVSVFAWLARPPR